MELISVTVGRLNVHLADLDADQIANVFGFTAQAASITRPDVPEGVTQEDAYAGSEEYRADYDRFIQEQNRVEFIGLIANARHPLLFELSFDPEDMRYKDYLKESAEIARMAERMGFVKDERYPDELTEGHQLVYVAEKGSKFYPEGVRVLSKFLSDCLRKVGFVGGDAISAEIKSEESDVSGDTAAGTGIDSPQQAEDPIREAQPVA